MCVLQAWQEWMLKSVPTEPHSPADPFWSAPRKQLVGCAYVYLAPVAYGLALSHWIPIVDYRGESNGELRVTITPQTKPSDDPDRLLGSEVSFSLTLEAARGMIDCPNEQVHVEYWVAGEKGKRKTSEGTSAKGSKFEPKFGETHEITLPKLTEELVSYARARARARLRSLPHAG